MEWKENDVLESCNGVSGTEVVFVRKIDDDNFEGKCIKSPLTQEVGNVYKSWNPNYFKLIGSPEDISNKLYKSSVVIDMLHDIVNKALCHPDRIKNPNSNNCAIFVDNYIKDNLQR